MIRLALKFFTVTLVTAVTTLAYADVTFGTTTNPTTTGRFKSRLSAENYLNTVTQMDMQTKNNLSQQVKDLFPKQSTPTTPGMANQPPASTPNQPAGSITISNPATPTTQPGTSQQTSTMTTTSPTGAYRVAPSSPDATPQQSNTYTGFGGGAKSAGSPSNSGNSGSSSGLGIKY